MPRILVTGDRPLIRTALRLLISSSEDLTAIAECANTVDAVGTAAGLQPDVVVMDFDLDAGCGAEPQMLAQLIRAVKGCPLLIVTDKEDPKAITCALQYGVLGIVVKTRDAETLLRAIRSIAAGESWLERSIVARVLPQNGPQHDRECTVPAGKLTRRETEIVELVSFGLQNKKIAERLFISESTVRHHLTSIYGKLSVTNRLELMRYTYRGRIATA
jgi:DNA-binding NarL/FixJ family response regulator